MAKPTAAPDADQAAPPKSIVTIGLRQPVYQRLADLKAELENDRSRLVSYSEITGMLLDVYREVGG